MKKVCVLCNKEKEIDQFTRGKKWVSYQCKDCDNITFVFDGVVMDRAKKREKDKVKNIRIRNVTWVNNLINSRQLKPPSNFLCCLGWCTNRAQQYHHIKYDSRSLIDPYSIIAPLCISCHRYVHGSLNLGVDLSYKMTEKIILEYKPSLLYIPSQTKFDRYRTSF